jgi:hypothetical protein
MICVMVWLSGLNSVFCFEELLEVLGKGGG